MTPPREPWRPGPVDRALAIPCVWLILLYRVTLSPFLGRQCRFEPTCSRYALDAYRRFGARWGTWLTARRLLRCHPLGRSGYDPVPVDNPRDPPPGEPLHSPPERGGSHRKGNAG